MSIFSAARAGVPKASRAYGSGIWEHAIRDEADFAAHLDYIHINPVKHGLVTAARDWPYSTFQDWVARGGYDEWWGSDELPPLPDWSARNELVVPGQVVGLGRALARPDTSQFRMLGLVKNSTQPTSDL